MNDSNEPTWQEVVDMSRQRWGACEAGRLGLYPASEHKRYSYEEILAELRHVLRDTERFHRERPEKGDRAILIATMAASPRDQARVSAGVGTLGDVAGDLLSWLVRQSGENDFDAALDAAERVINGDPANDAATAALTDRISVYVSGSDPGIAAAMQRAKGPKLPVIARDVDAGMPLGEMEQQLLAHVAKRTDDRLETGELWRQFQSIMGLKVAAEIYRQVDDEMFLFECWENGGEQGSARHCVSFVRQISWADARGEYAGMTHLRCELYYDEPLASETLWSDGDADGWIRAVEANDVFQSLPRVARTVSVELGDV